MSHTNNEKSQTEVDREKAEYEKYTRNRKESERLENFQRTSGSYIPISHPVIEEKISFENLSKYILKRDTILKNVYKPFIGMIKNCYVRVPFAKGRYSICKILGIQHDKEYEFAYGRYKMYTDVYLVVKHRNRREMISISYVSNSGIEYDEFMQSRDEPFESERKIASDYDRVLKLMDRELKDFELKSMFEEKRKFLFSVNKRKSYFKTDLHRARKAAVNARNKERVREIDEALAKIEDEFNQISSVELNAIGRKFNLTITGSEIELPSMGIHKDR
ncbi:hypothetical protein GVAV_000073 [Gurleya vavrai]